MSPKVNLKILGLLGRITGHVSYNLFLGFLKKMEQQLSVILTAIQESKASTEAKLSLLENQIKNLEGSSKTKKKSIPINIQESREHAMKWFGQKSKGYRLKELQEVIIFYLYIIF